jgi:hypothetical protein
VAAWLVLLDALAVEPMNPLTFDHKNENAPARPIFGNPVLCTMDIRTYNVRGLTHA